MALADMTEKDKMKLGIAVGGLLLALVIIYWFVIRTPPSDAPVTGTPAAVDGASKDAPAAANRRVPPPAGKK